MSPLGPDKSFHFREIFGMKREEKQEMKKKIAFVKILKDLDSSDGIQVQLVKTVHSMKD